MMAIRNAWFMAASTVKLARRLPTGRWLGMHSVLPDTAGLKEGTQFVLVEPVGDRQRLTLYELLEQVCDAPDGEGVVTRLVWAPIDAEVR